MNIVLLDLEILPDTPEHQLRPNSPIENRTLACKGNVPIQWHFKQYDETLIMKTVRIFQDILELL